MRVLSRWAGIVSTFLITALLFGSSAASAMGYHGGMLAEHTVSLEKSHHQVHDGIHHDGALHAGPHHDSSHPYDHDRAVQADTPSDKAPMHKTDRCCVPGCFFAATIQFPSGMIMPLLVTVADIMSIGHVPDGLSVKPDRPPVIS